MGPLAIKLTKLFSVYHLGGLILKLAISKYDYFDEIWYTFVFDSFSQCCQL